MNRLSSWLRRAASASTLPAAGCQLSFLAPFVLPAALHASSIAVKRGHARVDPGILPLVCLEVGTVGAALPLDFIVFENLGTHDELKMVLTSSFDTAHPDMLTAAAPGSTSLSLPILRFKPGRYRIKSIDFVSGGLSTFTMNLADNASYWFEVKAGCVNYVGGLEIEADRGWIFGRMRRPVMANESKRGSFSTSIRLRETAPRDVKWACELDPGMLALPLMVSPIPRDSAEALDLGANTPP